MKICLGIIFLCLFLSGNSLAGVTTSYKKGSGPLKVTEDTANVIEYFFSGGKNGVYAQKQKEAWKKIYTYHCKISQSWRGEFPTKIFLWLSG